MWILSPVPAPGCRSGCSVPHLLHRSRGGSFRTEPLAFSCLRATGSAQGLRSTFSRGRATASIEPPSERPALAVLLLRVLPFSSGRSRLNDWRRSDRRLQPNSGFQRWRTVCGRGPALTGPDDGAPGGAFSFPRHVAAVPFLGTPSRAGRRPRGPLPYRPSSCFQCRRTRSSCAPRAPIPDFSWRSARLSPGPPGDVRLVVHAGRVHPSRKDPHPSDAGCRPRACCHRRVRPGVGWPPRATRRSRPPPPHGTGHRALAEIRRVRPTSPRGSPREVASLPSKLVEEDGAFDRLGRHPCRQRLGRPDRLPGER
jgi:hypothetical protein